MLPQLTEERLSSHFWLRFLVRKTARSRVHAGACDENTREAEGLLFVYPLILNRIGWFIPKKP
jgi:hypothetical protein